jgi:ABC-type glycerol-3-phosphate transport system permease component
MILPYIAGQQIFGIVLARSFYGSLPQELFDAARIDGANEAQTFLRIALPLSVPTLITVGVTCVVAMYNDYIWPTIVLTTGDKMKTFCQIVFNTAAGRGSSDLGLMAAAFIIGTLPLLTITCSCLKYYLRGMIEGAVKG